MTNFNASARRRRIVAILTAWVFVFGATQVVLAKNGNNSGSHSDMKSGNSDHESKKRDKSVQKHKDKDDNKYTEKHKKYKDKDKTADKTKDKTKDKTADKDTDKAPVIITGGFVRDKLPNGTVYYRRATKDELDKAAKGNGGATATTDKSGGTAPGTPGAGGTASTGNAPPPAAPPATPVGDAGPVVRDHRQGEGIFVPGNIFFDHRNGANGTPTLVVSNKGGVITTRKATDDELVKAGLKKPAPVEVEVPMGSRSGGL
jgi:hypothetical protein